MTRRIIIDFYSEAFSEDARLTTGLGRFEFARTKEIIQRYLSTSPQAILDIGGGTGPYAFWLASLGHYVHLVDMTPAHIRRAREKSADSKHSPLSVQVGDACSLPFADDSADCVLLLGPLYHLVDRAERIQALLEARRVLKPGGVVFCAAISRYASMLAGFCEKGFAFPEFEAIVDRDLQDGQHRSPDQSGNFFTTAFFHRPQDLRQEVAETGLTCEKLLGVEGPVGLMAEAGTWLDEGDKYYNLMLKYMRATEEEEALLGASFHLLAVGRKR